MSPANVLKLDLQKKLITYLNNLRILGKVRFEDANANFKLCVGKWLLNAARSISPLSAISKPNKKKMQILIRRRLKRVVSKYLLLMWSFPAQSRLCTGQLFLQVKSELFSSTFSALKWLR